jgi:tripartite-type tricarboxylate transporter receptor subunit TctC
VPFAPGGGVDSITRVLAQKLTEQIPGSSFVTDNRPGAGGVLGADLVAKAAPDGYTLLTSAPEFSINPGVRKKLPYDALKDFAFISQLTSGQFVLAAHPSMPVRTVKQLVALATARPGQLNYGSSGNGSINHLAGALLQSMANIDWVHVPFKGAGPALLAVMGGEIGFAFGSTTTLLEQARAGRVRAIAVTGPNRFAGLPEVPTVGESIPGYSVTGWYGFYAPGGTPAELVRRLHAEAVRALNNPDAKENLARAGNETVASTPADFAAFIRTEIAKWSGVAREAKLMID